MSTHTTVRKDVRFKFADYLFDGFLLAAAALFFTGAAFLIHGPIQELVNQKPWVHRAALSGLVVLMFIWLGYRHARGRLTGSPLTRWLAALRVGSGFWVWALFFLSAGLWTASAWTRHEVFHTSFDMAIFVQAIWNTYHGAFLYSSIKGGICLLADHFSPLLALLAPVYGLWPDPRNLLLIQAVAAAACVFPIYRLAQFKTGSNALGLAFAAAFVLYLPVRNAVRFDFHSEVLAMPLWLWSFYWLIQNRLRLAGSALFVALLSKEGAAPVVFALGFYAFFFRRARLFGVFWMLVSVLYFFTVIHVLIPRFFGEAYFYLDANFLAWKREGAGALLRHLLQPETVSYLIKIYGPLAFLSVLDFPAFLLTGPAIVQNLTARNEMVRSIFFQYTAFLTPFVFISAIDGAAKLRSKTLALYLILIPSFLMTGVSEYYVLKIHQDKRQPGYAAIQAMLREIPAEASLRTHEFFAPHAAHRKEIHIYENNHPREGGSEKARKAQYVVVADWLLGDDGARQIGELKARGYQEIQKNHGVTVLHRTV